MSAEYHVRRRPDSALRAYAAAECLMWMAFDEIYNSLVDGDDDDIVPDCRPSGGGDLVPCEGDPCLCPEDTWPLRRYMPDDWPELQVPDPPRCPAREALFTFDTADGEDADPVDDVPDRFTCDGVVYCPDGRPPAPGWPGGECAAGRP